MADVARSKRGEKRRGPGRPPGPLEQLRRNRLTIMLTDGELEQIRQLAEEEDSHVGTLAHGVLSKWLRRRR